MIVCINHVLVHYLLLDQEKTGICWFGPPLHSVLYALLSSELSQAENFSSVRFSKLGKTEDGNFLIWGTGLIANGKLGQETSDKVNELRLARFVMQQ